jgi:hypothetical protein
MVGPSVALFEFLQPSCNLMERQEGRFVNRY